MQVRYNGEYAREQRSYGCSKCGTGRSISGVETYRTVYRTYYSGRLYIFEQGKTYPVDDILGRYLTNLRYTDKEGVIRNTFTEVPDDTEATYVKDVEDTEFHIPEAPKSKPSEEPKPTVTEEAPKPPVNEPKPAEENKPVTEEPKPSNEADKPTEPKETEEAPKPIEEPKPTPQPVEEEPTTTETPAPTPEEPKPAEEPKPSEEPPVDTGNAGGEALDHLE